MGAGRAEWALAGRSWPIRPPRARRSRRTLVAVGGDERDLLERSKKLGLLIRPAPRERLTFEELRALAEPLRGLSADLRREQAAGRDR